MFEFGGNAALCGLLPGSLIVSVYVLVVCFPHLKELLPYDGDDACGL